MRKVEVQDRVDTRILDEIEIAPEVNRFTGSPRIDISRFANRFAKADAAVNRFAGTNRFAKAVDDANQVSKELGEYLEEVTGRTLWTESRFKAAPAVTKSSRIVVIIPPLRTEGQLLWIGAKEYTDSIPGFELNDVWPIGGVIDFNFAAEERKNDQGFAVGEDTRIHALSTPRESATFRPCDCDSCENSELSVDIIKLALSLRAELAADPQRAVEALGTDDLESLRVMVGFAIPPTRESALRAIIADSKTGLGAAALDWAVWRLPNLFGNQGVAISTELDLLENGADYPPNLWPLETFLFHTGSLHPGTVGVQHWDRVGELIYPMTGEYIVSKITYTSDLSGKVLFGWRSCWVEPKEGSE